MEINIASKVNLNFLYFTLNLSELYSSLTLFVDTKEISFGDSNEMSSEVFSFIYRYGETKRRTKSNAGPLKRSLYN